MIWSIVLCTKLHVHVDVTVTTGTNMRCKKVHTSTHTLMYVYWYASVSILCMVHIRTIILMPPEQALHGINGYPPPLDLGMVEPTEA